MRITRETLIKLAQDTVAERVRNNRGIVSAYVSGSLLTQDPLLGGATDIDLFIIHDSYPAQDREVVRLSPDVHLDIVHHSQALYHHPRHLRSDLWLGSTLYYNPILLHDTQHWFEFTQSSVRSLFWQADNVMRRARPLAEKARQNWMKLQGSSGALPRDDVERFALYIGALEAAANAVASLTGAPLPERRFLLIFPERAKAVDNPSLAVGLTALLGETDLDVDTVQGWIPAWKNSFQSAGERPDSPIEYHPIRLPYYERAIEAMLAGDAPQTALWPLLNTWIHSLSILSEDAQDPQDGQHLEAWQRACSQLGFTTEAFEDRLSGLDSYLDSIEETLDQWGVANGADSAVL